MILKNVVKVFLSAIHLLRVCLCKVRDFFCNYKHIIKCCVGVLASIVYFSFPFFYRILPFYPAQFIWYFSLTVLVFLLSLSIKKSYSSQKDNNKIKFVKWYRFLEFKTPFTISLFLFFALVFVHNYYLSFSFTFELWLLSSLLLFNVCLIMYLVIQNKLNPIYSSEELLALIKKALYQCFVVVFGLVAFFSEDSYSAMRCLFIFATIYAILIVCDLISNFLAGTESYSLFVRVIYKYYLICEFVIALALVIFLIQLIPDSYSSLQTIITTVISSVIGGTLTLVGVAWTIKRQDSIHANEEKIKNRPLVFVRNVSGLEKTKEENDVAACCIGLIESPKSVGQIHIPPKENETAYNINLLVFNTDISYCCFRGFYINEEVVFAQPSQVFDKRKYYNVIVGQGFSSSQTIKSSALLLGDLCNHYYRLDVSHRIVGNDINILYLSDFVKEVPNPYQDGLK